MFRRLVVRKQSLQATSMHCESFSSPIALMLIDGLHDHGIDPALVLHIFSVLILSTFMVEVSIIIYYIIIIYIIIIIKLYNIIIYNNIIIITVDREIFTVKKISPLPWSAKI